MVRAVVLFLHLPDAEQKMRILLREIDSNAAATAGRRREGKMKEQNKSSDFEDTAACACWSANQLHELLLTEDEALLSAAWTQLRVGDVVHFKRNEYEINSKKNQSGAGIYVELEDGRMQKLEHFVRRNITAALGAATEHKILASAAVEENPTSSLFHARNYNKSCSSQVAAPLPFSGFERDQVDVAEVQVGNKMEIKCSVFGKNLETCKATKNYIKKAEDVPEGDYYTALREYCAILDQIQNQNRLRTYFRLLEQEQEEEVVEKENEEHEVQSKLGREDDQHVTNFSKNSKLLELLIIGKFFVHGPEIGDYCYQVIDRDFAYATSIADYASLRHSGNFFLVHVVEEEEEEERCDFLEMRTNRKRRRTNDDMFVENSEVFIGEDEDEHFHDSDIDPELELADLHDGLPRAILRKQKHKHIMERNENKPHDERGRAAGTENYRNIAKYSDTSRAGPFLLPRGSSGGGLSPAAGNNNRPPLKMTSLSNKSTTIPLKKRHLQVGDSMLVKVLGAVQIDVNNNDRLCLDPSVLLNPVLRVATFSAQHLRYLQLERRFFGRAGTTTSGEDDAGRRTTAQTNRAEAGNRAVFPPSTGAKSANIFTRHNPDVDENVLMEGDVVKGEDDIVILPEDYDSPQRPGTTAGKRHFFAGAKILKREPLESLFRKRLRHEPFVREEAEYNESSCFVGRIVGNYINGEDRTMSSKIKNVSLNAGSCSLDKSNNKRAPGLHLPGSGHQQPFCFGNKMNFYEDASFTVYNPHSKNLEQPLAANAYKGGGLDENFVWEIYCGQQLLWDRYHAADHEFQDSTDPGNALTLKPKFVRFERMTDAAIPSTVDMQNRNMNDQGEEAHRLQPEYVLVNATTLNAASVKTASNTGAREELYNYASRTTSDKIQTACLAFPSDGYHVARNFFRVLFHTQKNRDVDDNIKGKNAVTCVGTAPEVVVSPPLYSSVLSLPHDAKQVSYLQYDSAIPFDPKYGILNRLDARVYLTDPRPWVMPMARRTSAGGRNAVDGSWCAGTGRSTAAGFLLPPGSTGSSSGAGFPQEHRDFDPPPLHSVQEFLQAHRKLKRELQLGIVPSQGFGANSSGNSLKVNFGGGSCGGVEGAAAAAARINMESALSHDKNAPNGGKSHLNENYLNNNLTTSTRIPLGAAAAPSLAAPGTASSASSGEVQAQRHLSVSSTTFRTLRLVRGNSPDHSMQIVDVWPQNFEEMCVLERIEDKYRLKSVKFGFTIEQRKERVPVCFYAKTFLQKAQLLGLRQKWFSEAEVRKVLRPILLQWLDRLPFVEGAVKLVVDEKIFLPELRRRDHGGCVGINGGGAALHGGGGNGLNDEDRDSGQAHAYAFVCVDTKFGWL